VLRKTSLIRLEKVRNQSGPARLVRCSDAAAVLAVEILVEKNVIAKIGVILHLVAVVENWAAAGLVFKKNLRQTTGEFVGNFADGQSTRTGSKPPLAQHGDAARKAQRTPTVGGRLK
jgi:hypothetical protein